MECFSLKILIKNQNTISSFPLFSIIILIESFLLLQNHFLKDNNLGKIVKKLFMKLFNGIFLFVNTNRNHNTNPSFPLFSLIILVENFLLLQNHFLKDNNLGKFF